jgi:hypothetical protein
VRYRCAIRQFLNRPGHHGRASVIASVEDSSRTAKDELRYNRLPDIYLNISDCSKSCTLTFSIRTRGEQKNSLYKIDTLVSALTKFRDALVAEIDLYNIREEEDDKRLWDEIA